MSTQGNLTMRRYSEEQKAHAVRLARAARAGQQHGAVKRVAQQLGYGVPVRAAHMIRRLYGPSHRRWVVTYRSDGDADMVSGYVG